MKKERQKERIKEIEILRALAFIFVLFQHSLGSAPSDISLKPWIMITSSVIFVIAETAVPIFLFLTGLTNAYQYGERIDLKKYYKNKIIYIIIPYLIWSAYNMKWHNPERLGEYFINTIAGNGAFHLWYMALFIRLILVMPLIIIVGKFIHKQNLFIRVSTFIGGFIGCYYLSMYQGPIQDYIAKIIFGTPTDVEMRIVSTSFLFWAFYVFLGVVVGFNYSTIKKYVIKYRYGLYLAFIIFFAYKYQVKFDFVPYSRTKDILYRSSNIFFFLLLSIKLAEYNVLPKVMSYISKYSYVGYLIHIKVLFKWIFKFRGYGVENPVFNSVLAVLCAALIIPTYIYLLSLIPYSGFVTGVKSKFTIKELFKKIDKVKKKYIGKKEYEYEVNKQDII